MKYLPQELLSVPPVGQLYGGKATLNLEEMMATGSQVMIDIGDYKNGIEADLDSFTAQTGIPAIFLAGDLESLASSFRKIGALLKDKEERAEEIASFIDETISMAKVNSAKVKEEEKVTIMFSSSTDGLGTNAKGSSQAQVIDFIGAINAIEVEKVSAKGGGNQINMEQLYNFNPDIILFAEDTVYDTVSSDPAWAELDAIKKGLYYEIPSNPYCWMGTPPSLNMVLGIWWLGNLVYPQYYDYDMVEVTKKAYKVFWGYDMTSEEAMSILSNSTLKTR
ncbi:MAG: ABC transporter substrate-binding protein [Sphaerochaetaceae bacterium]|nr:ABC transporter substrate-binding protein [Sphaerochaetaceae bacterium]